MTTTLRQCTGSVARGGHRALARARGVPGLAAGLGLCLCMAAQVAQAMAVAGGAGEPGRRLAAATPPPASTHAAAASPTLDLVAARLDAVDPSGASVTVRGQRVPLHPTQLRVLDARGLAVGLRQLRAGQQVRLALEPLPEGMASPASAAAAVAARRIVLIFIDA